MPRSLRLPHPRRSTRVVALPLIGTGLIDIALAGIALIAIAALTAHPAAAEPAPCGSAQSACQVSLGTYHLAEPETPADTPRPAFIYFHGAGGTGRTIGSAPMAQALMARGYVVAAPNGLVRPNTRFGPGWSFRPEAPQLRDELAFTRQLIDDLVTRHNVDPARIVLTGYSIGGSLVWYLACRDATLAAAYTPYAGGFWRPHPQDCDGPVKLLHTHGWRDQTVPLEGRPLRGGAIEQGDIFEGLQRWRTENGCTRLRPDSFDTSGRYWRRKWEACAEGTALEFALWPGGHTRPDAEWAEMAADWVEATLAAPAEPAHD